MKFDDGKQNSYSRFQIVEIMLCKFSVLIIICVDKSVTREDRERRGKKKLLINKLM